ncbi:hypothetical protein QBC39DRAFT_178881 [Podospora conica]|nr:hypothetical protein QBC39DRAFT_178881 [Schizothecium conicum]
MSAGTSGIRFRAGRHLREGGSGRVGLYAAVRGAVSALVGRSHGQDHGGESPDVCRGCGRKEEKAEDAVRREGGRVKSGAAEHVGYLSWKPPRERTVRHLQGHREQVSCRDTITGLQVDLDRFDGVGRCGETSDEATEQRAIPRIVELLGAIAKATAMTSPYGSPDDACDALWTCMALLTDLDADPTVPMSEAHKRTATLWLYHALACASIFNADNVHVQEQNKLLRDLCDFGGQELLTLAAQSEVPSGERMGASVLEPISRRLGSASDEDLYDGGRIYRKRARVDDAGRRRMDRAGRESGLGLESKC